MTVTLTAKRPKKKYNCPTTELYSGLEIIWKSQSAHEAEFANENTLYTAGLWMTRKAAIKAARDLPSGDARYAASEVLRISLLQKHEQILSKWNSLQGFIKVAFAEEYFKTRIEEAGKKHARKALMKNWEDVEELAKYAGNFMTAHSGVLIADGGMPANFAAGFNTLATEFKTLYEGFMEARQLAQEQTDLKILANNAIWKDGQRMMMDARQIFRKQASVRERFTWAKVRGLMGSYGKNSESGAVPGEV